MARGKYEELSEYGVAFKNIISGPAPVGRVLNYVILAGQGKLRHKNGYREINLENEIASAWCSEFMVGLGLVTYIEDSKKESFPLSLTPSGKRLYNLLKDIETKFDEDSDVAKCKKQLKKYSKEAYIVFETIFKNSIVFKNLYNYVLNQETNVFKKDTFMDEYFGFFKLLYTGEVYNPDVKTSTAKNRVPSLLQFCDFFDLVTEDKENNVSVYKFDFSRLGLCNNEYSYIKIDEDILTELEEQEENDQQFEQMLIDNYGFDGTITHEIVSRCSEVQRIFRNNLISKYGMKCAICDKDIEAVLIASHIKPASNCNVVDKADCENGILLCAIHDKLFDRYLITFDSETGVLVYKDILKDKLEEYQLYEGLKLPNEYMTEDRKKFLKLHNNKFYNK